MIGGGGDGQIPFLTVGERAVLFGLSFAEQLALEREQPWVKHWSARFDAGAEHLRSWLAAGRPAANRSRLCVVGDPAIVKAVREVVDALPESVAWFLVNNVFIVCGDERRAPGWSGPSQRVPCPAIPIWISAGASHPCSVAHELAHAMHAPTTPPPGLSDEEHALLATVTAADIALVVNDDRVRAVSDGRVGELVEYQMQREGAADALATMWGFPIDSTSGARGEARRRGLRAEIERAANKEP